MNDNTKLSRFFVGLTFDPNSILCRKIQGFRHRFDPKFNQSTVAHMSMLAPFDIATKDRNDLIESLTEEVDNYFHGDETSPKLAIQGLDVYRQNKQSILYLNPKYPESIKYCQEAVREVCESFISPRSGYKQNDRQFIPLGYFSFEDQLLNVMENAVAEFQRNGELGITGISLFEKRFGMWILSQELINFQPADFLQYNHAQL